MGRDVDAERRAVFMPPVAAGMADIPARRRRILESDLLLVEDSALPSARPLGRDYSPDHQIVLPYFGAFGWRVGAASRLIDPNSILFVTGRQEFTEDHPIPGIGHGSAILTPRADLLAELVRARGDALDAPFAAIATPMMNDVQLDLHRLLFEMAEPLAIEERAVAILRRVLPGGLQSRPATRGIIERTKQIVHELAYEPLSLGRVAREVGVSPIYLSQSFSRLEGMPLYRYQTRLRLGRALVELPHRNSLTELALDLGFSSHSHFTAVFRAAFGVTPSQFRACRN